MPRRARMYLPGYPYHIVQRGNNREACFVEPENYPYYLELWKENARRYGVAVHAYCLMTNHIHFLVTPEKKGKGSSLAFCFPCIRNQPTDPRVMQAIIICNLFHAVTATCI